jgi:hypothetical protein
LTQPSLPALVLTLLIPAAGMLLCTFGITPAFLAQNPGLVAISPQDTDIFNASRILGLRLGGAGRPSVFLIGASTLLRSVPDVAALERELEAAGVSDIPVEHLGGEGATVSQMKTLVALLPERLDGVVVIEVTPRSLASPANDADVRQVRWHPDDPPGTFFWRNKRFFLPRLLSIPRNLILGRMTYEPEEWLTHRLTEAGWQVAAQRMRDGIGPDYAAQRDTSFGHLSEIVARLRSSGHVNVALLECPLTARGYAEVMGPAFWDDYRARLRRFAEERSIPVWRLDEEAELVEGDFVDFMHLWKPEAQTRYMRALARHLAEFWKERT